MIFSQIDQKTIDTFGVRYHMHFSVKTSFAPPRETAVVLACLGKLPEITGKLPKITGNYRKLPVNYR